jgi:type III pantothenate kinase
LCEKYIFVDPLFVHPDGSNSGLKIALPDPVKIGADQIVNAVAALEKFNAPCVVIDFGTATTFDIINENGEFIGGVIAPGVNLSVEAMYRAAALLPRVPIKKPACVVGQNTVDAMQSGLYWGYVSMIEGMARRVADEMGVTPTFIATGGLADTFTHAMHIIDHAEPLLTLEGLRIIHCRNKGKDSIQSVA